MVFPGFGEVIKDKSAAHRQQDFCILKMSGVVVVDLISVWHFFWEIFGTISSRFQ